MMILNIDWRFLKIVTVNACVKLQQMVNEKKPWETKVHGQLVLGLFFDISVLIV